MQQKDPCIASKRAGKQDPRGLSSLVVVESAVPEPIQQSDEGYAGIIRIHVMGTYPETQLFCFFVEAHDAWDSHWDFASHANPASNIRRATSQDGPRVSLAHEHTGLRLKTCLEDGAYDSREHSITDAVIH